MMENSGKVDSETSVKVAVRIRPQNAREQVDMCRVCTFVTPNEPQVVLGKDKAFTFDYVYDIATDQQTLYNSCVEALVEGCFNGLNATVLAYGQTGSGKTYTMGTGFDVTVLPEEQGAVPRAVHHIFQGITKRRNESLSQNLPPPQFELTAQFLELYNEEIIDLFDTTRDTSSSINKRLKIHETNDGNIYVDGAIIHPVSSEQETLEGLKQGAVSRSVGSTNMNAQSSRSHAIYTLMIQQRRPILQQSSDGSSSNEVVDWDTLTAKFHFVDLAGSERLKRTGATGERAKEGISINCGLLSLGNVISALGDKAKKGSHVPYRDSKLTRLLQDSLGGNSQTLMIACVSPSDRDFMETLNTLKYANRARNIKNKVTVNQDKNSAQLAALHKRIQELEFQIQEFQSGKLVVADDGSVVINDLANENIMLKTENDKLRLKIKTMQNLLDSQTQRLAALQSEKDMMALRHHDESTGQVMDLESGRSDPHMQTVLQEYIQQIEDLRAQLVLSETQRDTYNTTSTLIKSPLVRQRSQVHPEAAVNNIIQTARTNIGKLEEQLSARKVMKSVRWKRRGRKRDRSSSPDRMSTDIEEWMAKSEFDNDNIFISPTNEEEEEDDDDKGSDTDVNEDNSDCEEENKSDTESMENLSWSSDSGEDEPMDDAASIATSIAELSTEINIKQQLVDHLEKAQRSLQSLRNQYEEKMTILQQQIRVVEAERDKVIKNLSGRQNERLQEEQIKEMKDKYEKELSLLKRDLKQLQIAKREHALAMKKNAQQDSELRKMKTDLTEMKTQKIKLMRQLKQETSVFKINDQKKEKELVRLRTDHRKKETLIKALQADARKKEIMLKRKNEEVQALRRQQSNKENVQQKRETSLKPPAPASTVAKKDGPLAKKARLQRRQSSIFSSDNARRKWRNMEKLIKEVINRRQTMNIFETDLERWIQKREELSHRADQLKLQRDQLLQATEDIETLASIEEELDALAAQISWSNDSIEKLQEDIMTFEDTKAESDTIETTALIHTCSTREAKYLLEHVVNMAIDSGTLAAQKDCEAKSLQLRLTTSENHAELLKIYSSPHAPLSPLVINSRTVSKLNQMQSTPYTAAGDHFIYKTETENEDTITELDQTFTKHRRRTAVPAEIKHSLHEPNTDLPSFKLTVDNDEVKDQCDHIEYTSTSTLHTSNLTTTTAWTSPPLTRRASDGSHSPKRQQLSKKRSVPLLTVDGSTERQCPGSPLSSHGSLSRLSSLQETSPSHEPKSYFEAERSSSRSTKFLVCTHVIRGHTNVVLTLSASDNLLVSGSQDCTAKIWDLITGQETASLSRHHSYVRKVTYSPSTHLVFTACQSIIKGWDIRDPGSPEFIKSLLPPSQGNSADTVVQDIVVNDNILYSAAGPAVHVWDLRQMNSIGRLVGHNGLVGTMATMGNNILATGSRDRLIKLYETKQIHNTEPGFTQLPQSTLSPAHYDTVTSLAVLNNNLYSSCGVSIKKWDISKHSLVHAVDGAHAQNRGNTITSLDVFLPSLLISTCKAGNLKMWLTDNCQNIGDINAHKMAINSVTVNHYSVFTASSDKTVKIWRPNSSFLSQNS